MTKVIELISYKALEFYNILQIYIQQFGAEKKHKLVNHRNATIFFFYSF